MMNMFFRIDLGFTLLVVVVAVGGMIATLRTFFFHRAHMRRMEQYGSWIAERGRLAKEGKLSEDEEREMRVHAHTCLTAGDDWDYRGPWEKT